jgi:hypothetical protein
MIDGPSSLDAAEDGSAADDAIAVYEAAARRMRPSWDAAPTERAHSTPPPKAVSTPPAEGYVPALPSVLPVQESLLDPEPLDADFAAHRQATAPTAPSSAVAFAPISLPAGRTYPATFELERRRAGGRYRQVLIGAAAIGAVACVWLLSREGAPTTSTQGAATVSAPATNAAPASGDALPLPPSALAPAAPMSVAEALIAATRVADVAPQPEPVRPRKGRKMSASKPAKAPKLAPHAAKQKPKVAAKKAAKTMAPARPGKGPKLVSTNPY